MNSNHNQLKVVIVTTVDSFGEDRHFNVVDDLDAALRQHGHRVETYRIPFTYDWKLFLEQIAALRLIDVPGGDRMIAIKGPSYLIMHPHKVVWFTEHYRPAYDHCGTDEGIPDSARGRAVRDAIHRADSVGLQQARHVYAASRTLSDRLRSYNALDAQTLHAPLLEPERFRDEGATDYILCTGGLEEASRLSIAIEAMRYVQSPVRMIISAKIWPGLEQYLADLRERIAAYNLVGRVLVNDRPISDEERAPLIGKACAIAHLPRNEFSFAHAVLESAAACKPVIAASDSGVALEIIVDGESGWIVEPTPQLLAAKFDEAFADRTRAREKGTMLSQRVRELGIDWPTTIKRLLA